MNSKKLLVLLAVAASACGGNKAPDSGEVVQRKFTPAHWEGGYRTEYRPEFKCRTVQNYDYASKSYRSEQQCGTEMESHLVYEAHHHYVGDRYQLKLESCTTGKSKKCRSGWLTLSEDEYSRFREGDHYPDDRRLK